MKKIILLIMGFMLLLMIASCTKDEKTIYNVVNNLEGVTLEIKEETFSNVGFTVIIQNESEYECTFGVSYWIEKNINNN